MSDRLAAACAALDAAHGEDPVTLDVGDGPRPRELVHAEMATHWIRRLVAEPADELLLAARGHHLRRWAVPRSSYPDGRAGYLRWRRDLNERHARDVGEIVAAAGYDEDAVARVRRILRKEGLRADPPDPDVQAFEDALCLVFLQTQLADVAARLDEETVVSVLAKTAAKMSPAGVDAAKGLALDDAGARLLARALGA